ncbi:hypothetical protein BDZ45DRAFT_456489 [Acephala macrosclerotiorum]|nr:hypothetical protein BDZ45DRAFT_456489 [Acephala macrosclerotiorum]
MYTNGREWAGHDGTLDLSNFTALRTISTGAELFFTPLSLNLSQNGLFRLLPNSLGKLKLTFPFSIGMFYPMYNRSTLDEVGKRGLLEQRMDPVLYQWILELALHKLPASSLEGSQYVGEGSGMGFSVLE